MGQIRDYFAKHKTLLCVLALAIFCYLLLFLRLGFYPLIDVDETRYVGISADLLNRGDWITMFLNGVPFLEKPPLYFWLNAMFFDFFGEVNPFSARFMTALLATFAVFYTFFFSRKVLGVNFALISSLILLSNFWFILFSHIAILDMGFMVFTMSAIYSAVLTLFAQNETSKKLLWWAAYLFVGLSVLMKGLIGIIIPFMVVFLTFLALKKAKELFKPIYIIPGVLILFASIFPWHFGIYNVFGFEWVHEYILKHHFARFLNSAELGRKQPFLFYVPIILLGFLPWTFNMIAAMTSGVKAMIRDVRASKTLKTIFSADTNDRKIILFASIYFLSVFLFFSISSTKLPSYVLTLFPALSILTGYYWWGYLSYNKYERGIRISTFLNAGLFLLIGIVGYILLNFYTPLMNIPEVYLAQSFSNQVVAWVLIIPLITLLAYAQKNRSLLFSIKPIFMFGITLIATTYIFAFITQFGQNELEKYAKLASSISNSKLATYDFSSKYSIMNNFEKDIYYLKDSELENLKKLEAEAKEGKYPVFLIVKNDKFTGLKTKTVVENKKPFIEVKTVKENEGYANIFEEWNVVDRGKKYTLLGIFPNKSDLKSVKFYIDQEKNRKMHSRKHRKNRRHYKPIEQQ